MLPGRKWKLAALYIFSFFHLYFSLSFVFIFFSSLYSFKGYFPCITITEYCPYSLWWTIHPWAFLTPNNL